MTLHSRKHIDANPERATKTKPITSRESFWRLLHSAVIKDLACAALNPKYPDLALKKVRYEEQKSQDNH